MHPPRFAALPAAPRQNKRHVARRVRSLPSGSWLLRPPVTACITTAAASCSPALCQGMQLLSCGIGGARTPRALLRSTPRADAMFVRRVMAAHCCGTPRARASAQGGFRRLRAGQLVELTPALKGAAKVRAVLASSRKRLPCAAGGASFWSPPSPPLGRYPTRYAVSAAVCGPVNAAWRPGCPRLVLGCQRLLLPRGAAQRAVAAL